MISLFLIIIASIFNAIMDILENENYFSSKFKNNNQKWWYKRESWKYAKKIFGWKYDGWHIFKSLMIISLIAGVVLYAPLLTFFNNNILNMLSDFLLFGFVWNMVFGVTYKFLKKV